MAILKTEKNKTPSELIERELEIKKLINNLEVSECATVEIACKITAYRTSFEYYKKQFNSESGLPARNFSFIGTKNPSVWEIYRIS